MQRVLLATRVFFAVLFHRDTAQSVRELLSPAGLPSPQPAPPIPAAVPADLARPQRGVRSEALTLLAALQRESRWIDMVMEPLEGYSDARVGAAARSVLQGSRAVLERMFSLVPVVDRPDGAEVEVPAGFDAQQFRLTGEVAGSAPFRGRLVHHGWRAERSQLPQWNGAEAARLIVAPAEVELS